MSVKSPLSRGDGTHSPPKRIVVGRSEQENFDAADQGCVPGARRNTYTYVEDSMPKYFNFKHNFKG